MGGTLSAGKGLEGTQTPESEGSSKKGGTGRRVLSSWEEAAAWGGVLTQGLLVGRGPWRGQVGDTVRPRGKVRLPRGPSPSLSADPRAKDNSRISRGMRREPAMWPL